jgi:hypothetical protein
MKRLILLISLIILAASCSTQKELSYLNNLYELGGENYFPMEVPTTRSPRCCPLVRQAPTRRATPEVLK